MVGGVIQGVFGGVTTNAFVFTSLLTIPAFSNIPVYAVSVLAAFFTAMVLVIISDYRTSEDRAEVDAIAAQNEADAALEAAQAAAAQEPATTALTPGAVTELVAPLSGTVMAVEDVADPVFASGALGKGAGIEPAGDVVVTAPAAGTVVVAPSSGHAYGIALDNGVEILVHVGIDTVNLEGQGFDVRVSQGDRVEAGQELVRVDRAVIEEAGYPLTTPVLVTNTAAFADVELIASGEVAAGQPLLRITAQSEE